MRLLVFFLFLVIACNQAQNNSDADKKIGPTDTVSISAPRPDTISINNPPPVADTATKKTLADTTSKNTGAARHESLQNFWALETVDGKSLDPKNFPGGTPYLQLNLAQNKASGFAGCNSMNGSFKVEGSMISFGKLATTKSTCNMKEFENNYVNNLSGHKVHYVLQAGRLVLTTEQKNVYVYHKMQ